MRMFIQYCALLLALTAGSVQAATICVDKKDTLEVKCKDTIQEGVDAYAAPGDIVTIKAGTYFEDVTIPVTAVGIIIKGSGKTIIDPAALGTPALIVQAPTATISGLTINNVEDNGIEVETTATGLLISKITLNNVDGDCINIDNVDGLILSGFKMFSCDGDGIDLLGDGATISKNKFTHIASNAIRVRGDNNVIEGNACSNVSSCVRAEDVGMGDGSDNVIIRRNKTVEHSGTSYFVDGNNAIIEGNSSANGDGNSVDVTGDSPQVLATKSKNDAGRIDVECDGSCTETLVERNSVTSASDDSCFDLDFAVSGAEVRSNSAKACGGTGFVLSGDGSALVEKNKVTVAFPTANGFAINDAGVKTMLKNSATLAGRNGFDVNGTGAAVAHVLEGNKSTKNGQDGFNLDNQTSGVILTGNTATANIQEGFDDRGMSNVYTENKASGNRDGSDFCSTQGTVPDDTNKFKTISSPNCVFP